MEPVNKYLDHLSQIQEQKSNITYYNTQYTNEKIDSGKFYAGNLKWRESRSVFKVKHTIDDNTLDRIIKKDSQYIRNIQAFFAKDGDNKIGFILASTDSQYKIGYIWGLYVLKEQRRTDVSRILFNNANRWLKSNGMKSVEILINAGNEPAIAFYKSAGFVLKHYALVSKTTPPRKDFGTPHSRVK